MSNETPIADLVAMRDALVEVIKDVKNGKDRQHDGRRVTFEDLTKLSEERRLLDAEIRQRCSGRSGIRTRRGTPRWRR